MIEGNFSTVIDWIQSYIKGSVTHPLLQDIVLLLRGVALLVIRRVYCEANFAADWVALFVSQHSYDVIWTCLESAHGSFRNILFSDLVSCILTRLV